MKINKSLSNTLLRLLNGETVPGSALGVEALEKFRSEGLVTVVSHGSRRTIKAIDRERLLRFLQRELDLPEADAVHAVLEGSGTMGRSELVHITGNSKFSRTRSMFGFLVNSYEPAECLLNNRFLTVSPLEGTFVYISDYEFFRPGPDVAVVGIENAENFRLIRKQRTFFEEVLPGRKLLFVSRYPQSGDLGEWLEGIPNAYYHFGDLDLAGISIYLTEFYARIGRRASFLIPPDAEYRLQHGSTARYDAQYRHFRNMQVADSRVQPLVELIHQYHRGYDQEGYIESGA